MWVELDSFAELLSTMCESLHSGYGGAGNVHSFWELLRREEFVAFCFQSVRHIVDEFGKDFGCPKTCMRFTKGDGRANVNSRASKARERFPVAHGVADAPHKWSTSTGCLHQAVILQVLKSTCCSCNDVISFKNDDS